MAVAVFAVLTAGFTAALGLALDLPLRDPDGIAGPAYVRLPAIIALLFALDVIPRALWRARGVRRFAPELRDVVRANWSLHRVGLVLVGLVSFYLTYVAYRNLKSFLPFARTDLADLDLLELDRAMTLGAEPSDVLHAVLGTGVVAHVLSAVYVFFLIFVPLSLGVALVWSRDLRRGYWWVTALCVNWVLGALSYYVLPALGPAFVRPDLFVDLPATGATALQSSLWEHRLEVLADPYATNETHGIAAFASLHVSIVLSAALVAHFLRLARAVRWSLWGFLALTVIATLYFGWHYIIDDVAAVPIAGLAVWFGAVATGHRITGHPSPMRGLAASH
jgi:hypothetical protein